MYFLMEKQVKWCPLRNKSVMTRMGVLYGEKLSLINFFTKISYRKNICGKLGRHDRMRIPAAIAVCAAGIFDFYCSAYREVPSQSTGRLKQAANTFCEKPGSFLTPCAA